MLLLQGCRIPCGQTLARGLNGGRRRRRTHQCIHESCAGNTRDPRAPAVTQAPSRHRVIRMRGRNDVVLTIPVQVASVPGRGQRVSSRGTRARLGPMETTRRASRADLLDPAVVASLGRLEIVARWIVDGFMSGLHRSPRKGFSVEFAEYRPYLPGDDLRFIDWKIAARSDRWVIRQYEEETNLRASVVLDVSRSMAWSGAHMRALGDATPPARLTKL